MGKTRILNSGDSGGKVYHFTVPHNIKTFFTKKFSGVSLRRQTGLEFKTGST
jgi:hypothetical protein